jgi:ADP-heptose:LPS heptosyltransferase
VTSDDGNDQQCARFVQRMRRERFDMALQMHGGGRNSNPLVLALGARVTAGLRAREAPALDRSVPYEYYQHEVLRLLEVVALVGAAGCGIEPRLAVTASDRVEAAAVLGSVDRPVVALVPGAGDGRRRWRPEGFAVVGDAAAGAGAAVVVVGSDGDRPVADRIRRSMSSPALDLTGRLSLRGLVGVLEAVSVVVGNDTGPLHLAEAVGTTTVGVYWCGNVINAAPSTRTRHRVLLSWRLRCPVCGVDCTEAECPHEASFVADVADGDVVAAALDLLGQESTHGASTRRSSTVVATPR